MNRFKVPSLSKMFDACLALASDNFSEFYVVTRRSGASGPNVPRRGASHRHHFWNGYNGTPVTAIPQSLAYAAFRAGQTFRSK